ncbi:prepilin peptidase [Anaerocolumna xylanovorans]|uniref:Leader peptidase (Prepilin peptidase) / N-methyltransferase n=1 Tax=Anaerocolumna xylanovorans DSM 12503 TaxID=1121345 RepID=A0A1M7YMJ2_9FIRM|nr:prepilin peptidase [Anaerocolumna xylanovorans]SHO53859.1 leader peptidase (prepilin peptidase) / N-methyltransferase [Anaerocolumna xylanovorans DSM 12503]
MKVLSEILMGLWLLLCGWQDFKEKKISAAILAAGGVVLAVFFAVTGELSVPSRLLGFVIGLLVLLLSKLIRGQIGLGDGIILCITGLCLGFRDNLNLLFYSLTLAAVVSLVLLVLKRAGKKDTIPFIPFVFLSYLGGLFLL